MATKCKTFREVMAKFGRNTIAEVKTRDGLEMWADCWSDDDEGLDYPASFSVHTEWGWGYVERFDNVDSELRRLRVKIERAAGVKLWSYDHADGCYYQVDENGAQL